MHTSVATSDVDSLELDLGVLVVLGTELGSCAKAVSAPNRPPFSLLGSFFVLFLGFIFVLCV